MQEKVNNKVVIKDSFVDFEGKTHKFIIAAVKTSLKNEYNDIPEVIQSTGIMKISSVEVPIGLKIGVSICNPDDKYDENLGVIKAVGRAIKSNPVLYALHSGQLGDKLIHTFLAQEVEYIKKNPEKYIKGYNNAKDKYNLDKEMQQLYNNFTDIEKLIVKGVQNNPNYLDNINKYVNYINKCEK